MANKDWQAVNQITNMRKMYRQTLTLEISTEGLSVHTKCLYHYAIT